MKTDTNGLDAYFTWAHRKADRLRRYRLIKIAALMGMALAGCTTAPEPKRVETSPDEKVISPIAAINVSRCDGALVLYVILDGAHIVRFDRDRTTILVRSSDGKIAEQSGPVTPWENAIDLAASASITANTAVACDGVGT